MDEILNQIKTETYYAMKKYPEFNSLHEAYAVILEEIDELWENVKMKQENRIPENIRKELIQIAAMAIRTLIDCGSDFQK
jgi:hypothetical protein